LEKEAPTEARVMDSNDLEKERGITILSKCTSIQYKGHKINILDTPGHSDFGGEVERILSMVDSVLLLMDVSEGPMPQTKFVLQKALLKGLTPIVVLNKIDRPGAEDRSEDAMMELMELFESLGASPKQIEQSFDNVIYCSAINGWATRELGDERSNLLPLMETIVEKVPAPAVPEINGHVPAFKMLTSIVSADKQWGRLLTGKVTEGQLKPGQEIKALSLDGTDKGKFTAKQILYYHGTNKEKLSIARAGDIISIATNADCGTVTDTLCAPEVETPLETDRIQPPVLKFRMTHNDSPLHGKDGKKYQKADLEKRLMDEVKTNVSLDVEKLVDGDFEIGVRGELQLAVLLENMRREGYEMQLGAPRIVFQEDKKLGIKKEPIERLRFFDVALPVANEFIDTLSQRYGEVHEFNEEDGFVNVDIRIPSRALVGFEGQFRLKTRGIGTMVREFDCYDEFKGEMQSPRSGVIVSCSTGKVARYACHQAETKGGGAKFLFVEPGQEVYEGQICGEYPLPNEKVVSFTKGATMWTEVDTYNLQPVKALPLEEAVSYIQLDELCEVTPKSIRLRKVELDTEKRGKAAKAARAAEKELLKIKYGVAPKTK